MLNTRCVVWFRPNARAALLKTFARGVRHSSVIAINFMQVKNDEQFSCPRSCLYSFLGMHLFRADHKPFRRLIYATPRGIGEEMQRTS